MARIEKFYFHYEKRSAITARSCVTTRVASDHANTCRVGIATQRPDLRAGFDGTADMLVSYLRLVAGEVRTILASLGLRGLDELVGRADLLRRREGIKHTVVLDGLLVGARLKPRAPTTYVQEALEREASAERQDSLERKASAERPTIITNTDRAFGSDVAGEIAARHGDAGLPAGSVQLAVTGSAGQSFGAFSVPGMRLTLVGDANDGLGKGMHGGEIIVAPEARERGRAGQVLVGNAALYGATGAACSSQARRASGSPFAIAARSPWSRASAITPAST